MLRNFFALTIFGLIICAGVKAEAAEIYVGKSLETGYNYYVLTDTIYRTNEHRMAIISVTLKVVNSYGDENFIDYDFFALDAGDEDVQFTNSEGDKRIANEYETPIEWAMYMIIKDY